ncbi:MAG: lytic murein transglycosylase [Candidatus Paceibacterota bacterium]|jgi:membrane-bound lytic murein transglycosylase B
MYFKTRTFFFVFTFLSVASATVFSHIPPAFAAYKCDTVEEKAVCTKLLNQTEAEIMSLTSELNNVKQEGTSLARDKQILDLQIKQAQLKIKASELTIANLGKDIVKKTETIKTLQGHIDAGRQSLGQIIRQTNQIDDISLPEIVLGSGDISSAFADLDAFDSVKVSMAATFTELRDSQRANEEAKVSLGKQQDKEKDSKSDIEAEKAKVQAAEAEKRRLLNLNKTQQQNYQASIANKAAEAAQIRAALFKLAGGNAAIPFGTALQYARAAEAKTGVSAAFVLAILTQESNLGANVGQCYMTNSETAEGIRISSGAAVKAVMKPSRDVKPFLEITAALGRDWKTTRVSCPLSIGYGGAMGPAQFIPSTWVLFTDRLTAALGTAPDPWNPPHAFMASAMYLADLGGAGGAAAQKRAACKYYGSGGATCAYGNQVMAKVAGIQADIDILDNN